jgi:putative transposase
MGYGYRRLHVLLRREGWILGRELAYRLYTEESPQLRSKRPRRRKMVVARRERYVPKRGNQAWSMDFVADQLAAGRKPRALTVVDVFTREALCIRVGQKLHGEDVVDACNRIVAKRGAPARVFEPTDNSFVESFNGSFRDECLNVHWFESLEEAREKIETWRIDYNDSRPHQGLKDMTPTEFALKSRSSEFGMVPQQTGD